jgi:hypothetical protein
MGKPIEGALQAVKVLLLNGHTVVVHSSRAQTEMQAHHVWEWLTYYEFPTLTNTKPPGGIVELSVAKPLADVYVDDKGLRFVEWNDDVIQKLIIMGVTSDRNARRAAARSRR